MAIVRVTGVGSTGVNKDLSQAELPINTWSDARNIRFLDGYAYQFYGHAEAYHTPSIAPYHLLPVSVGDDKYWIYAGKDSVYCVTMVSGAVVHTDISKNSTSYDATPNSWTSTVIGGIPILNPGNITRQPQMWDVQPSNKMTTLSNWPSNYRCASMRSYKSYLVAMGIHITGSPALDLPYMVKWSHPAEPGQVPISWDHTDPTMDAGEVDLAEGYDRIVDGLQLRDSFMIYKESSIWRMDYTGGAFVFRFSKVLGSSGAMNRNCIAEIDGYHVVLTGSDIIVHDGMTATSVLDKQTRRWLFQTIDVENPEKCFVFKNSFFNEVFICFPEAGSTTPNLAIVWNYVDKTISIREVPDLYHAAFGPVDDRLTATWDSDPAPWSTDLTLWNSPGNVPQNSRVLMGGEDGKLFLMDGTASFDGRIPDAYMERQGLSFDSPESIKLVKGVRPRITGNMGETVKISIGGQTDPWGAITWGAPMYHVIGTTIRNDCFVSGRYIAVRIETGSAYQWRLDSYDLEVDYAGDW